MKFSPPDIVSSTVAAGAIFLLAIAFLIALPVPAEAVDFTIVLRQIDGSPFPDKDGKPADIKLRDVAMFALLAAYPDEAAPRDPGAQDAFNQMKAKRFALAKKIHDAKGDVPLDAAELAMLKALIGKSYGTAVMGPAWQALDPASVR